MLEELIICAQKFPVIMRQNVRAKRFILRFNDQTPCIQLTVPPRFLQHQAITFLKNAQPWLEKQVIRYQKIIQNHAQNNPIEIGVFAQKSPNPIHKITLLDEEVLIHFEKGIRYHAWTQECAKGQKIYLRCPVGTEKSALLFYLKTRAREYFAQTAPILAEKLGKSVQKIRIQDAKTRWGSCSSTGNLSFSWRLLLAPKSVAFYVCAHEVAHLREMNHSPAFWAHVAHLCPDYQTQRRWLKHHGRLLGSVCPMLFPSP